MSVTLHQYAVQADDTIQTIARSQLGDVTRWVDIVALNKLRRPYISSDLPDQFGSLLGQFALQGSLAAGATQISNWDTTQPGYASSLTLFAVGNIVLFTTPSASGSMVYDAAQITAVTQTALGGGSSLLLGVTLLPISDYHSLTQTLTASIGGMQTHPAGATLQVYGNPTVLSTAVARTGDLLALPVSTLDQQGGVTATTDLTDALGTDQALDHNGQKQVGPTGAVLTVAGIQNVTQALRIRVNTAPGELQQHPGFGCEIQYYLGARQDSYWPSLAQALVHDCVLQDPRVQSVDAMQFTQVEDTDFIRMDVAVAAGGQLLTNTIPLSQ